MNDLQKKEMELLTHFVRVCEILGLRYYLVCGTALGAVKYGGFIPWDDDVDVALCRRDYETFIREAPKHLPPHIFVQTYHTDPCYPIIYCKLRNSETTYIEKNSSHIPMNHGAYIDVFPLDGYPTGKIAGWRVEIGKKIFHLKQTCSFEGNYSLKVRILRKLLRLFGVHKRGAKTAAACERLLTRYPTEYSALWCNHGNWQGKLEYAPREQYGEGIIVRFEGLDMRVPEKYDEYLTQKYGDWRADLPEEKKVGHHHYEVMDLTRSYTEYLSQRN